MTDSIYTGKINYPKATDPICYLGSKPVYFTDYWWRHFRDMYRNTRAGNTDLNGLLSNANLTEAGTVVTLLVGSTLNIAGTINITGTFKIDGTTVTITADQLNTLDGIDITPADGALLIGNSGTNKYDSATLTAGDFITITNGPGSITIDTNQFYVKEDFTAQTSVVVTHNFGVYPVVQVFETDGTVLIPNSITHDSINAFTVAFSASTSGSIVATLGTPSEALSYVLKSANYTITVDDYYVEVDTDSVTITLPTAIGITSQAFQIINSSIGDITVDTTSSQTINGSLTQTISTGQALRVVSNGNNWLIV